MGAVLKGLSWLCGIMGAGAIAIVAMVLIGLANGDLEGGAGMAILGLGIYAVLFVVIGLIAGFIAYFIASSRQTAMPLAGRVGLWLAGSAGTIIALALMLD